MKIITLLAVLIISFAGFTYAKTEAEKECRNKAGKDKFIKIDLANILCDGATSLLPLDCFDEAHGYTAPKAILCSGAKDAAPLACFEESVVAIGGSNLAGAILCSGVTVKNWIERVECYKNARGRHNDAAIGCAEKGRRWVKYLY